MSELPNFSICDLKGHHWIKRGSHRVPCQGHWPDGPEGTIQFTDYKCKYCPVTQSDEVLYSWLPLGVAGRPF